MKMIWGMIILLMAFMSPAYGEGRKVARVTVKATMVETSVDNLKGESVIFKNMDDFFKDPDKVKKTDIPPITTLAGNKGNIQIGELIYYIKDAEIDENGDIICKLGRNEAGVSFQALPEISGENPERVTVEYQIEIKNFVKRVDPQIPAVRGIRELKSLWWPIINTRTMKGSISLENGTTLIVNSLAEGKPIYNIASFLKKEKKPEGTLQLTLFTAKWKWETIETMGRVRKVTLPIKNTNRVELLFQLMRDNIYRQEGLQFLKLEWSDIPDLLKLAESAKVLSTFPINPVSSYIGKGYTEGMVALWLIEGIRKGSRFASLNPLCFEGVEEKVEDWGRKSEENHKAVYNAYRAWWEKVKDMSKTEAAMVNPLEGTNLYWH